MIYIKQYVRKAIQKSKEKKIKARQAICKHKYEIMDDSTFFDDGEAYGACKCVKCDHVSGATIKCFGGGSDVSWCIPEMTVRDGKVLRFWKPMQ